MFCWVETNIESRFREVSEGTILGIMEGRWGKSTRQQGLLTIRARAGCLWVSYVCAKTTEPLDHLLQLRSLGVVEPSTCPQIHPLWTSPPPPTPQLLTTDNPICFCFLRVQETLVTHRHTNTHTDAYTYYPIHSPTHIGSWYSWYVFSDERVDVSRSINVTTFRVYAIYSPIQEPYLFQNVLP